MTKIKICGLKREEDIEAVNRLKPDFCGFIVEFPKSSRNIDRNRLRELRKNLCSEVTPVGVFVDAPIELVAELLNDDVISMAQLHGHEDAEYIASLKQMTDKPLIKAFIVKDESVIDRALACEADYILLDQGLGGGKTFDWSLIPEIKRPFFLAGGLDNSNLKKAAEEIRPYAVDLSSSLETEGFKDPVKMAQAIDIIRYCR